MESINKTENGIFQCARHGIRFLDGAIPKRSRNHDKSLIRDSGVCESNAESFGILPLSSLW